MPQRRAAKKDLRQSKKRYHRNLAVKRNIRVALKTLKKSLEEKDSKARAKALEKICKLLDKAVSSNVIHKNKAANKKSRLSKLVNPSTKKTTSAKKKSSTS
ncbi:MAG: 30S ribosomal protein S20 [Candidatus Omnitrophica bacterium]|nr:30S ribosomal protein S20 [Candidatus Omnitrophota bacterium]